MKIRNFIEVRRIRPYSAFDVLQKVIKVLDWFIAFLYVLLLAALLLGAYFTLKYQNYAIIQINQEEVQTDR